jgi:hypothetical protein
LLVKHLLSMSSPRRSVLFTCGWMITGTDEDAIRQVLAAVWKPGTGQGGAIEEDTDVAEITQLMSRAGNWPGRMRWIARRVSRPAGRCRTLTAYEKKTGWRYSITRPNIPDGRIAGVPGSHHPSKSTPSTANTPSWRPPASGPPRPWALLSAGRTGGQGRDLAGAGQYDRWVRRSR